MALSALKCQSAVSTIFFDLDNTLIHTREGDKIACEKFYHLCYHWSLENPFSSAPLPWLSSSTTTETLLGYPQSQSLQPCIRCICSSHQLSTILVDKYILQHNDAKNITTAYLQSFVLCPHNPEYDIEEWRVLLWTQALQEHSIKAVEVYSIWLKLRYECLALSPEISGMLKKLSRNFTLALITNGTSSSQWEKINILKLRSYFSCILVSGDLPWEKPNKNIFLQACDELGVKPQQCVMVGDKLETDILGGKEAQLAATIWISGPDSPRPFEFHPDFTLASVLDLNRIFPLRKPTLPEVHDINSNSSDGS